MINKKLVTNILITLCYAVFTLIIVLHHEIWSDEAQVWQLVKYLSVPELFRHLVNEGHPSLFYLLVMPFAKAGLSIFSMQLLCWISGIAAVFLLFQFSPYKLITKLAIMLSAGFLYAFPVIARSYSIIPALVFLLAILYKRRNDKPVLYATTLFFLAHTHIIMYGFAGILTLLFGIEKYKEKSWSKKNIFSIFVMLLGLLLVFLQLHGTYGNNVFIRTTQTALPVKLLFLFTEFFQNTFNSLSKGLYPLLILFMSALFIYIFIVLFRFSKKAFTIAFCGILAQFAIYLVAYTSCMYTVRIFCAYIILIFAFWVAIEEHPEKQRAINKINIILSVYFALSFYNTFSLCLRDYFAEYSSAKSTVEFIRQNATKDTVIMTNIPFAMNAIVTYFDNDYDLIFIPHNEPVKYTYWDKKLNTRLDSQGFEKFLDEYCAKTGKKDIYIIESTQYYIKIPNTTIIYKANPVIADYESFIVLQYNYKE